MNINIVKNSAPVDADMTKKHQSISIAYFFNGELSNKNFSIKYSELTEEEKKTIADIKKIIEKYV